MKRGFDNVDNTTYDNQRTVLYMNATRIANMIETEPFNQVSDNIFTDITNHIKRIVDDVGMNFDVECFDEGSSVWIHLDIDFKNEIIEKEFSPVVHALRHFTDYIVRNILHNEWECYVGIEFTNILIQFTKYDD